MRPEQKAGAAVPASPKPAATGANGRDRVVDALRAGSLAIVIAGHWLMADVSAGGHVGNALATAPRLQPLTWVLQVMPLFFLVGGVAHGYAWRSANRRGLTGIGGYGAFVGARAQRLLRPTLVLIAVWVVIGLVVRAAGATEGGDGRLVVAGLRLATQLLWFVGIYLVVAVLAPAMLAAHRRWQGWVVAALAGGAVTVDVLRFAAGMTMLATLNYALVWLAVHQLGFCWYSGLLTRRVGAILAVAGTVGVVAGTTLGPYPVSMVGLPGDRISNMAPPTAALLAQAFAVAGVAVLMREPIGRLLRRARVWRGVVGFGTVAMTAFLWHLTALFVVVMALRLLRVSQPVALTARWWLTRPGWLAVLAVLTTGLVAVFRRFDSPHRSAPAAQLRPTRGVLAITGAVLAAFGILMVSITGVDVVGARSARFIAFDVTPAGALTVVMVAAVLLAASRQVWPRRIRPVSNPAPPDSRRPSPTPAG